METSGWDLVSALSITAANAQLMLNTAITGAAFTFTWKPVPTSTIVVTGHFASWQLVTGGSGQKVHLAVTVASGSLSGTTAMGSLGPWDLAGVAVTIEVPLLFVTGSSASSQLLQFDFSTAGSVTSQSTVTVVGITLPTGSTIDSLHSGTVGNAIAECVYNNPASASHVFATLIPNPANRMPKPYQVPKSYQGGTQFYDPTTGTFNGQVLIPVGVPLDEAYYVYNLPVISAYAFEYTVSAGNTGIDYLTIFSLAQITGDAVPTTTTDIDSSLVDFSSPVCLGLSARYFLKYVLMPQLPGAYGLRPGGWEFGLYHQSPDIGRFNYQNDQITSTGGIGLPSVSVNGIGYNPQIDSLAVTIVGTQLQTVISGSCDITSGVSITFSYTSHNSPSLVNNQLVFTADPSPSTSYDTNMTTAAKVANVFSLDTFYAISNAVGSSIFHSINNNLDGFGVSQLSPEFVQWTDYAIDTLGAVGLNDVFYARGSGHALVPTDPGGTSGIIPLDQGGIHGIIPLDQGGGAFGGGRLEPLH